MVSLCYGVYLMLPTFILHVKPRGKSGSGVCVFVCVCVCVFVCVKLRELQRII